MNSCTLDCNDNWLENNQSYFMKVENVVEYRSYICVNNTVLIRPSYNEIGETYLHRVIKIDDSLSIEKFKDTIWLFRGDAKYWFEKNISDSISENQRLMDKIFDESS